MRELEIVTLSDLLRITNRLETIRVVVVGKGNGKNRRVVISDTRSGRTMARSVDELAYNEVRAFLKIVAGYASPVIATLHGKRRNCVTPAVNRLGNKLISPELSQKIVSDCAKRG